MPKNEKRRDFLFSIRPEYAELIVDGSKTVELRRRFPTHVAGSMIVIYSTSPKRALIGHATISRVFRLNIEELWALHGDAACIDRSSFDNYFSGLEEGVAIVLEGARPLPQQITASDLQEQFGFVAPQSYMYLKKEYYPLLNHERPQTLN